MSRSVVHKMLGLLIALAYVLFTLGLARILPVSWTEGPLFWAALAVLLALLFTPLLGKLRFWVDGAFFGGAYDHRAVLGEMSRALAGIVDADDLASLLVEKLPEVLHAHGATLLLPTVGGDLTTVKEEGLNTGKRDLPPLPHRGVIVGELLRASRPLTTASLTSAVTESVTDAERAWLDCSDVELWVPLVRRGAVGDSIFAKLQGVVLLSSKGGREGFDSEDRRLLGTLAWGAAVAAENVELFAALRRRAEEVNQLYSRLVQSREDERERLARELHDRVIQDLVDLHYLPDSNAPPGTRAGIDALRSRLQNVINNIREVCAELRPSALDDLSLGLAMQGCVDDIRRKYGLRISLQLPSDDSDALETLSEDIRLSLYRVLQEPSPTCTVMRTRVEWGWSSERQPRGSRSR